MDDLHLSDEIGQQGQQPQRFTSYLRDGNESDEAQMRRYNRWWSRFDQPDPYDGSYNLADPQSLNRYSYVQNDPVNFVDPSGLNAEDPMLERQWQHMYQNLLRWLSMAGDGVARVGGGDLGSSSGGRQDTPTTESRLQDATNLARTALSRAACRGLFADDVDPTWLLNSLSGGLSRLGDIEIKNVANPNRNAETTGLLGPPTYNLQRDGTFRAVSTGIQGARITINSNPQASFNAGYQNANGSQRFGVSDDINRAITLIHELGHAANFIYGEGSSRIMQNDVTPTGIVSQLNSLRVYRACFEAVH